MSNIHASSCEVITLGTCTCGAHSPALDPRTAHLARALFADLDYVLGVDPNTLAAFCVRVLDEYGHRR